MGEAPKENPALRSQLKEALQNPPSSINHEALKNAQAAISSGTRDDLSAARSDISQYIEKHAHTLDDQTLGKMERLRKEMDAKLATMQGNAERFLGQISNNNPIAKGVGEYGIDRPLEGFNTASNQLFNGDSMIAKTMRAVGLAYIISKIWGWIGWGQKAGLKEKGMKSLFVAKITALLAGLGIYGYFAGKKEPTTEASKPGEAGQSGNEKETPGKVKIPEDAKKEMKWHGKTADIPSPPEGHVYMLKIPGTIERVINTSTYGTNLDFGLTADVQSIEVYMQKNEQPETRSETHVLKKVP
ncbi:MAG: hypothetical protein Q7R81_02100 [Candidatus Peregrinibacteria bacterium]|nr:hypothetical protein [Candidatus Peregrinibacteria bacterium]